MSKPVKSARGVYYDLTVSPYEYHTPYGDLFKFSSQKKLEIYTRDIKSELIRIEKALARHNIAGMLPDEILQLLYRAVYRSFYRKVEG